MLLYARNLDDPDQQGWLKTLRIHILRPHLLAGYFLLLLYK